MNQTPGLSARHRARFTIVSLVVGVLSVLLFAYTLGTVGLADIGRTLQRFGVTGFLLVLALSGARLVVRSLAWMTCIEGDRRLSFWNALSASVMGEALGNVTPLATLVSEPAKAVFVARDLPLGASLPALVVENIVYTATVGAMIGLGAVAFMAAFPMPAVLRGASVAAIGAMLVIVGAAWVILTRRATPLRALSERLSRYGVAARWLEPRLGQIARFEERISTFGERNRERLGPLGFYETMFHVAGVAEVYVTLWFIAPDSVTFLKALVLEAVGRVINVLFKFIPMRFGVDEAGNVLLARPLALPQASLVALPLVRKARILVWTALGVALLLLRGFTVRKAVSEAEQVRPGQ